MDEVARRVAERYGTEARPDYIGPGTPEFQREILAINAEEAIEALKYVVSNVKGGKVQRSLMSFELALKMMAQMTHNYGDDDLAAKLKAIAAKALRIDIKQAIDPRYQDRPQR